MRFEYYIRGAKHMEKVYTLLTKQGLQVNYIGTFDSKDKIYNAINEDLDECGSVMVAGREIIESDDYEHIIIENEVEKPCIVGVIE